MRTPAIIGGIYAVLGLLSLVLLLVGVFGWFGAERDPIAGAFAMLLAIPWSLALDRIESPGLAIFRLFLGMALNLLILVSIGKLISHRFGAGLRTDNTPRRNT